MRNDDLIVLSHTLAMIAETGELIPSFAGGDGGGEPEPVVEDPKAEEKALYAKQVEATDLQMQLAREQRAREEALLPAIYKQYGLQMVKNQDGTYTATEAPKDEIQQQNDEITKLANARELAALKGNLPVDPSVEQDLARQKSEMQDSLARRGVRSGSGDIYNRASAELDRNQNAMRYAVRHGEMTTADALSRGRQADLLARQTTALTQSRGGTPITASILASSSGQYGQAAQPYAATRFKNADYRYNTDMMEAQGANQLISGGMSAGSGIIGAALLACWIAEVLYGRHSRETTLLRLWLNTLGERYRVIEIGMVVYRRYGRSIADWLSRHRWAHRPTRWLFNRLLWCAVRDLKKGAVFA